MMPRRPRSAADPPKRTPTFVCEVPLRVSPAQERVLLARLEAARQVYNACLGQARRRVRLVRESKAFQHARTLPRDDPARKERFREARAQHGFSEYALHAYAQQFGHSWLGEHLDSLTIQTLASAPTAPPIGCCWGRRAGSGSRAGTSWTPWRARPTRAASAGAGPTSNGRGWCCRRCSIRRTWCRRMGWPAR